MDRLNLDEQTELLREGEPEISPDARRDVSRNEARAGRWKQIQAFDAAVGVAVRAVSTPEGLAGRVLERLSHEATVARPLTRRKYLVSGVGAAVALTLLVGVSIWHWPDKSWTAERVAAAAAEVYRERFSLTAPGEETPPFPHVGIRSGFIAGFEEIRFLKTDALAYRLEAGGDAHAVAIIVDARWFPAGFDPSPTYSVTAGQDLLEVRYFKVAGGEQYCILVARDLKPFEAQPIIS